MITIRLDIQNAEAFSAPWEVTSRAAELYVLRVAAITATEMRKVAPKGKQMIHPLSKRAPRNRSLASQIAVAKESYRGINSYAVIAPTRVDHARHVIFGTSPHQIDIRRAKTLTIYKPQGFVGKGGKFQPADKYGFIHLRTVKHPGTKPNDFRVTAIANMRGRDVPAQQWRKAYDKAWAAYQGGGTVKHLAKAKP